MLWCYPYPIVAEGEHIVVGGGVFQLHGHITATAVVERIDHQVAEDGFHERFVATDFHILWHIDVNAELLFRREHLHFVGHLVDNVGHIHLAALNFLWSIGNAGNHRKVGKQSRKAFHIVVGSAQQLLLGVEWQRFAIVFECFQTRLNHMHRSFDFVVDIVGELVFDTVLFALLKQHIAHILVALF